MAARLKPYPVMKDSGVPWLGEVPGHWEIKPNRAIFEESKSSNHPYELLLSVTISKGVIRQSDLLSESAKKDGSNLDKSKYKLVLPGEIAYNKMRAWQGSIGLSRYRGIISPAYIVERPRAGILPEYMNYLLRTPAFAKEAERWSYGITSDMWSLRPEHFKMIYGCLPPIQEQAAIVRFLDHMDRRIRRYIRAKQRLISLLEEQKAAIIHRAVTRGLDPSAPLKPSGVEWLGDVPEHWKLARLSHFFTLQRGFDITKDQQVSGCIPVVSSGGATSFHNCATAKGPGVLVGRKGTAGAVHYVETDYWAHDTTLWVNDFRGNHPKFIYYVLIMLDLKRFDTGSANPTINRNLLHPERLAFPMPIEQISIAAYLDASLALLRRVIDGAFQEISLLREYRARLISDVVTGKLDVRGVDLPAADGSETPEECGDILDGEAITDDEELQELPAEGD